MRKYIYRFAEKITLQTVFEKAGGLITASIALFITCLIVESLGFPIVQHIADAYIGNWKDTYLNSWTLYQALDNLLHWPIRLGYSSIFYPTENSFSYTIAPYGIALVSLPVYLLSSRNLILTYNLYLLLTNPTTAWAVYKLVKYLWKAPWLAAFLAAMLVTFYPFRVAHIEHIETSTFQFLVISLYIVHRLLDTPDIKWMVGLSLSFFLTYTSNAYFGVFLAMALLIILAYALLRHRKRIDNRLLGMLAGFAIMTAVLCLPFLLFRINMLTSAVNLAKATNRSASLGSWLLGNSRSVYWAVSELSKIFPLDTKHLLNNLAEQRRQIGPGYTMLVSGIAGLVLARRQVEKSTRDVSPRFLDRRDLAFVYIAIALVGFVSSFGPQIEISDYVKLFSPYQWLMNVPVLSQLRAPRRFAILTVVGLAVGSCYAMQQLLSAVRPRQGTKYLYSFLLLGIATVELLPPQLTLTPEPLPPPGPEYFWLAELPPETAVFHYPPDDFVISKVLQYQNVHHLPMITGEGSFYPSEWYAMLADHKTSHIEFLMSAEGLEDILDHGANYVMVHLDLMSDAHIRGLRTQQETYPDYAYYHLELVQSFPHAEVYVIKVRGLVPLQPPEQAAAVVQK